MTEDEWLNCEDPEWLLMRLGELPGRPSDRKLRLFACACCRHYRLFKRNPELQKFVGLMERFADGLYDERTFARMPELADALFLAGCTDVEFLSHYRGPGPHVRGCWVVDLVLAKT